MPHTRMLTALALAAILAAGAGQALAQAQIGDLAPDFTLAGNDGNSYTLSDYRQDGNQQVVLLFMMGYA